MSDEEAPKIEREQGQELTGVIKFWMIEKGYGFVTCEDGGELFCHRSVLKVQDDRFQACMPGTAVQVVVEIKDGRQACGECTGPGSSALPGFGSKLEAAMALQAYKPGMLSGCIKFMIKNKGYGFIIPDNGEAEIFVHQEDIVGPNTLPEAGDAVLYRSGTKKEGGKVQALDVQPLTLKPQRQQQLLPDPSFYNPQMPPYAAYKLPPQAAAAAQGYPGMGMGMGGGAQPGFGQPEGENVGTVKWYAEAKGFGFIVQGNGQDIYFKGQDVLGVPLQTGEAVRYSIIPMGQKYQATNVSRLGLKRKAADLMYADDAKRGAEYMYAQQAVGQLHHAGLY